MWPDPFSFWYGVLLAVFGVPKKRKRNEMTRLTGRPEDDRLVAEQTDEPAWVERAERAEGVIAHLLEGWQAGGCREELGAEANFRKCWAPADFVLWGKLIPPEGLGPRCYDHAAKHLGHRMLADCDQAAIIDLRPLRAVLSEQEGE